MAITRAKRRLVNRYEAAFVVLILAVTLFFAYADDIDLTGKAISQSEFPSWAGWAGVPWSVVDSTGIKQGDILIQASPDPVLTDSAGTASVDITVKGDYVWNEGWLWNNGGWEKISFSPDWSKGGSSHPSGWILSAGKSQLYKNLAPGTYWFVAYTCQYVNGQWKCGCRDADNCGRWQMQSLVVTSETISAEEASQIMDTYLREPEMRTQLRQQVRGKVVAVSDQSAAESRTDFNNDGIINFDDFFLFADAFGTANAKFDLSGNGKVDFDDFFTFADNFGMKVNLIKIKIGDSFSNNLQGQYGTLVSNSGVKIQSSLTSSEDEYQTDVAMEVDRDSIRYTLINLGFDHIDGRIDLNILGHAVRIVKIKSDTSMGVNINGAVKTVNDGDAFIGEDINNPKWVWRLKKLRGETNYPLRGVEIGITNNFVYNDISDNLPRSGGCIKLPNNYAEICLVGLDVSNGEYDRYIISREDRIDYGHQRPVLKIASPSGYIKLGVNEINVNALFIEEGDIYAYPAKIFYFNSMGELVEFNVNDRYSSGAFAKINNDIELDIDRTTFLNNQDTDFVLSLNSNLDKLEIESDTPSYQLGEDFKSAESGEVRWSDRRASSQIINIGTRNGDHRTAYGIIVRNPSINGANDKVVLDIPRRQAMAQVDMKFIG